MRVQWRGRFAQALLLAGFIGVAVQLGRLQVMRASELRGAVKSQAAETVRIPAIRGAILDRRGRPLAVSTPVKSIYADPSDVDTDADQARRLAQALDIPVERVRRRIAGEGAFRYLKRQVPPAVAERVAELGIDGVGAVREYRRYYPAGEVAAHVVGFTGVDGNGLEGMELAFDDTLSGQPGRRLVQEDALGRYVRTLRVKEPARAGETLRLSIDDRLQFTAYQALKEAVVRREARAGMAVVLDPRTGEVLALANIPSHNPNNLSDSKPAHRRNRAVTDALEPGSIFKPFNVASALKAGDVAPDTPIQCESGLMRVGEHRIHDLHPMGKVEVRTVIQKSSNIGAAKIAMRQDNMDLWRSLRGFGFGLEPGTGFPGETRGVLKLPRGWQRFDRATMGFGQGVATSALQMARAYAVLANGGLRRPLTLRKRSEGEAPPGQRVIARETARAVTNMLIRVVGPEGTGERAALEGYEVAGKTGTAQKPGEGGYQEDAYVASFAGFAPARNPRLVAVVMIDEPQEGYYGGEVAAPVFRRIMARGLRYFRVPPQPKEGEGVPAPLRQAQDVGAEAGRKAS